MLLITVLTLNPHFLPLLEISTATNIFFPDTHKNSRSRQNGKHLSMAETQTTDWSHTLVYALMPPSSKIMTLKMFSRYIKPKRTDFSTLFHPEGSVRGVGGQRGPGFPQVWSLTQFYSVDFSQSRIGVKMCVFNERTFKVCVSCC